ncbi:hypothetical protein CCP2SC5_130030 [Azospirillaceae bacterium]
MVSNLGFLVYRSRRYEMLFDKDLMGLNATVERIQDLMRSSRMSFM